jgi:hypothetical protein
MESNTVGFKQSHLEKLLLTKNELAPLNRRRSSSYRKQSHCVCQPGISLTVSPTPFFFSFIFTLFLFLPPFSDVREVLGKKHVRGNKPKEIKKNIGRGIEMKKEEYD